MIDIGAIPDFTVTPSPHIYLGMDPVNGMRRLRTQDVRDSVGIVGPPGYGKTAGIIIPAVMSWSGPAVVSSTRGDILRAVGDWRHQLGARVGGRVYVYDPFGSVPGTRSLRWSPLAGCGDPRLTYRRVASMTSTVMGGVSDADHWRAGAARILRAYFLAAAAGERPLSDVMRWVAVQEVDEPSALIRALRPDAEMWADMLGGVARLGDRERGSMFSAVADTLEAYAEPTVLDSAAASDLDIDHFLRTKSTLVIVGPRHYQAALSPLIIGLVESIAQRAIELAELAGGKLTDPLLVALDEVANTPLPMLPALVSEGGGYGISTMWAVQSLAQLRERYGVEQQQAILAASAAKLVYGGMSNGGDLRDVSSWAGEHRVNSVTYFSGAGADRLNRPPTPARHVADDRSSGREHSVGSMWRPRLPVEDIQLLPALRAWLFYRSDQPLMVHTPVAALVPAFARLAGWTAEPVTA